MKLTKTDSAIEVGNIVAEGSKAIRTNSASSIELKKNVGTYILFGLLVTVLMFGGFFYWAVTAKLDSTSVSLGQIIVASRNKQVQHLDGGIVKTILVKDGDLVEEGDVLFELDDTQFMAQLQSINSQLWETQSSIVRLKAERDESGELTWEGADLEGADVPDEARQTQESLFASRQRGLQSRTEALIQRRMQSESQIEALQNQKRGLYASIKAREQEILGQNQLIKRQLQQHRGQIQRIKGQGQRVGGQQQQTLGQQQQIKNQQQQAVGIRQRIAGLHDQIKGLNAQIGSNYRQKQILDKEINRLRDLFARRLINDLELRDKERESERISSVIANIKTQIGEREAQIKQAQTDISRTQTEIARIQTQIKQVGSQTAGIHTETETMKAEAAGILAGIEQLKAGIGGINADIGRIKTEIARTDSDIKRIREGMVEIDHQIDAQKEEFLTQSGRELSQLQGQLPQLIAQKKSIEDRLSRIQVKAPVSGKVKGFDVATEGAVISPGQVIMELVPEDNNFKIIAEIEPKDRDSVSLGQKAEVRFSIFDNANDLPPFYAELQDLATDTQNNPVTRAPYYKASLVMDEASMNELEKQGLSLVSGMPVEVFVIVGKQTLFEYLMKPINQVLDRSFNEA